MHSDVSLEGLVCRIELFGVLQDVDADEEMRRGNRVILQKGIERVGRASEGTVVEGDADGVIRRIPD